MKSENPQRRKTKNLYYLMLFGRKISDAEDGDLALQRRVVGVFGEFLGGALGRR